MSKQRKRRKSSNAETPSTPKSKYHADDMFATPKTHHLLDDDSDSSPYSLSFSQRAMGVEVTWGEKSRPIPFKSKKIFERRDTDSPPTKTYFDAGPVATESPKGLYKFLLGWERRRIATQIEDDFERISDETTTTDAQSSNHTSPSTNNETVNSFTAAERLKATESNGSNSPNFKQLLNDSEDMNLMLCSQRIEQEVCSCLEPSKTTTLEATASKGFTDFSSDNDDDLLLALDDPVLLDKKLPHKSSFARHKSIAIQPNSSTNQTTPSNLNSNTNAETESRYPNQPSKRTEPSTPTTSTATASLVRHKSMPSPNVTNSTKKCSAEEIEIKRRNALAKLKLRKQRFTKK